MEQKTLITRIRNGEDEAFAELVNPLIEKGYRTSFSILKSKEQAEEVVQNALIEAYRNIMSGKDITYFNTWFYKLVTHRSIDVWRKNDRLKESPLEIDVVTDKHGVMESVLKEETENEIKKGISSLDNRDYRNRPHPLLLPRASNPRNLRSAGVEKFDGQIPPSQSKECSEKKVDRKSVYRGEFTMKIDESMKKEIEEEMDKIQAPSSLYEFVKNIKEESEKRADFEKTKGRKRGWRNPSL